MKMEAKLHCFIVKANFFHITNLNQYRLPNVLQEATCVATIDICNLFKLFFWVQTFVG